MSKEERLAKDITHAVGGINNIDDIIHCMTRIRIKIHDYDQVNYDELKGIDGVLGVVEDERLQVVVGPGIVNKVANYMADESGAPLGKDTANLKIKVIKHKLKNALVKINRIFKVIVNKANGTKF